MFAFRDYASVQQAIPVQRAQPDVNIEGVLREVESVIPDMDLDAARRTITAMSPVPSINDLVLHFLERGYTKKTKKSFASSSDRSLSLKRSISDLMDDIPKFLSLYSDPIGYFFDTKRKPSESYINHAKAYILRAFPSTDKSLLEQALAEENWHFLPTVRKLERSANIRTNAFLQRTTIKRSLDLIGERRDSMFDFIGRVLRIRFIHGWSGSETFDGMDSEEQSVCPFHTHESL